MADTTDEIAPSDTLEGTWRDRALERSLKTARAKAISRSDRFLTTAMEIMRETGRTDFTVQELVDRSQTSLRSFYQYFSGKDELLLALLEETVLSSVSTARRQVDGLDALASLEHVVRVIYGGSTVNRTVSSYHVSLAVTHGEDYRRALEPLGELIRELVERGLEDGVLRADLDADQLGRILLQTLVGSALIYSLGAGAPEHAQDADALWEFCRVGMCIPTAA